MFILGLISKLHGKRLNYIHTYILDLFAFLSLKKDVHIAKCDFIAQKIAHRIGS